MAALAFYVTAALPAFAAEPDALHCALKAPARSSAGQPVMLQFTLSNRGGSAVHVLQWNTPFEGWFGSYVRVLRDGVEVSYRGPRMKRGDPPKTAYLLLRAGQSRSASVDVALPFDLTRAGHYRIEPQITLFDVVAAGQGVVPRPRDQQVSMPLECNAVEIDVS